MRLERRTPSCSTTSVFGTALRRNCAVALVIFTGCGFGGKGVTPIRSSYNKGVYFSSTGQWDAAIAAYRSAVEEDEYDFRARFNLAAALDAKAFELEEAEGTATAADLRQAASAEYRRLLEQRPDSVRAAVNLAACTYDLGEESTALENLRQLAVKFSDSHLPHQALAARMLGRFQKGDIDALRDGLEHAERAVDLNPGSVATQMMLGDLLVAQVLRQRQGSQDRTASAEDLERAKEVYSSALEIAPEDIAALLARARLAQLEGAPSDALFYFGRVLSVDPDHLGALLGASEAHRSEGDLEGATTALWRARRIDRGRTPRVAQAEYRRRLRELYELLLSEEVSAEANE